MRCLAGCHHAFHDDVKYLIQKAWFAHGFLLSTSWSINAEDLPVPPDSNSGRFL
jgi:hypothetical protein